MQKIIVSDTSCLIILQKIGRLNLLESIFGEITITDCIANEFALPVPSFIKIENPQNINYQKILESHIDPGEASAIALALEKKNCLLIIDDLKGRKEAKLLEIKYTGTLGVLVAAKEKGLISSINEIIEEIKLTDFRISNKLIDRVLFLSGE
jgi:predicted nucleic acid-binding protein